MRRAILLAATLALPGIGLGADIEVSTGGTDSPTCGAPGDRCKTITHAMTVRATSGDRVLIEDGTYDTANGETFPIPLLDGVEIIGDTATPQNVVVFGGGGGGNSVVFQSSGPLSNSTVLAGLTMEHTATTVGLQVGVGVNLRGAASSETIAPIIEHNRFVDMGFGILAGLGTSITSATTSGNMSPTIRENFFTFQDIAAMWILPTLGDGDNAPVIDQNQIVDPAAGGIIYGDAQVNLPFIFPFPPLFPPVPLEGRIAPTITNNTVTGFGGAVSLIPTTTITPTTPTTFQFFQFLFADGIRVLHGATSTASAVVIEPLIASNTVDLTASLPGLSGFPPGIAPLDGINVVVLPSQVFHFDAEINPTISNNTVTASSGNDGIAIELGAVSFSNITFSGSASIVGNQVSGFDNDGISFDILGFFFSSFFADFDVLADSNTATENGDDGIDLDIFPVGSGGFADVRLDPTVRSNTTHFNGDDGIHIGASGIGPGSTALVALNGTLSGNRASSNDEDGIQFEIIGARSLALLDVDATAHIESNITRTNGQDGIQVSAESLSEAGIIDLKFAATLEDNISERNEEDGLDLMIAGIEDASTVNIDADVTFELNQARMNEDDGLEVDLRNIRDFNDGLDFDLTLKSNTSTDNDDAGLTVDANLLGGATVSDLKIDVVANNNTITGNGVEGLEVEISDWENLSGTINPVDVTITGNTVNDNGTGLVVEAAEIEDVPGFALSAMISSNVVTGNQDTATGLSLRYTGSAAAGTAMVTGNDLSNNQGSGVFVHVNNVGSSDPAQIALRNNTISGGSGDAIRIGGTTTTTVSATFDTMLGTTVFNTNVNVQPAAGNYEVDLGGGFKGGNGANIIQGNSTGPGGSCAGGAFCDVDNNGPEDVPAVCNQFTADNETDEQDFLNDIEDDGTRGDVDPITFCMPIPTIDPPLIGGDTSVGGMAIADAAVEIFSTGPDGMKGTGDDEAIGTGMADANGIYTVTLDRPLVGGETIYAMDNDNGPMSGLAEVLVPTPTMTPTATPTDTPTATDTPTPVPQGAPCSDTSDCADDLFCSPDGVCCDTACDGPNQVCTLGGDGICRDVPAAAPTTSNAGILAALALLLLIAMRRMTRASAQRH